VRTGASLTGIATAGGGTIPLSGTVTGSSIGLSFPSGGPVPGTATGTIGGSSVTGTWQIPGAGESGTFSGSTGC
ncbi:MAG TPA: hypothetical protein PLB02_13455, partial [Thermoanaerobaculia bacterium]|nr:hypothetical protein [Thermoanaerobaculia bacterium]